MRRSLWGRNKKELTTENAEIKRDIKTLFKSGEQCFVLVLELKI
jgi:hypothetical protein